MKNMGQKKMGRRTAWRTATLRALAHALLDRGEIRTTLPKAKSLVPFVEKLITCSRVNNLHNIRKVARDIQDRALITKMFEIIGPRFANRNGGYTRIFRLGLRRGDAASMALVRLVE